MSDEVKTPDPATDNQVPEWVPEKFRSNPEKFAESYVELERRLTQEAEQRAALEQNYADLSGQFEAWTAQQTQAQQQTASDPYVAAYESAMETGDFKTALGIQAQLARMAAQEAVQTTLPQVQQQFQTVEDATANQVANYAASQLQAEYGAQWEEARDAMSALVQANPHLIPESAKFDVNAAKAALDNVYKLATYGKPATSPGVDTTQMKTLAQTASGQGGRVLSPDEAKAEWDAIRAAAPKTYY